MELLHVGRGPALPLATPLSLTVQSTVTDVTCEEPAPPSTPQRSAVKVCGLIGPIAVMAVGLLSSLHLTGRQRTTIQRHNYSAMEWTSVVQQLGCWEQQYKQQY